MPKNKSTIHKRRASKEKNNQPVDSIGMKRVISDIRKKQKERKKIKGKFWQGKKTKLDVKAKVKDDDSWEDMGIDLKDTEENIGVHVYDGPRGTGYMIVAEKEVEGGKFVKTIVDGEEKEREHDWIFFEDEHLLTK